MGDRLIRWKQILFEGEGIFMFIRAQLSSQIATFVDFSVSLIFYYIFPLYYLYATILGSVTGGVVNCCINYKFTFRSVGCKKVHVMIKYIMVWCGSIFLNTCCTYLLTNLFMSMQGTGIVAFLNENAFVVAKVLVSVLVGFFWNYQLQKYFVYKNINIISNIKNNYNNGNKRNIQKDS